MFEKRLAQLRKLMQEREIDAVALVPGANLFYLTGLQMHLSERITLAILTSPDESFLLLPGLEKPRAQAHLRSPMELFTWSDEAGPSEAWRELAKRLSLAGSRVAVEALNMRVLELTELQAFGPRMELADASALLAELRMLKDESEIEVMRRAARVIETALDDVFKQVRPGVTEKELATEWQLSMSRCGADTIPEEPIVASGPNSAAPHITASARRLQPGDLVIFDGWCQVDGYFTDITRTVSLGPIAPELREIYEVVQRANEAGRQAVRPGVCAQEVDAAARAVIAGAGYGQYFVHRTGHGLGLEVHEPPAIVEGNELVLKPGMTFTIEPGIYLPGQGGVRIEDDVAVTQDRGETFTNYSRSLITL